MKPIIKIENLSKRYQVGTRQPTYSTLRETISKRLFSKSSANDNWFWALRDVNFTVAAGEVVGIIGRNGAGKSTLLKILSRITEPSEGRIELYGRTNSLLEVGTGFHPELTGRENIFVNGAILGLQRAEIKRLFDEIVDFAEIENFLDTPVKRYSSGMYMKLAFSVAAHLDPDILVIDEVLSVGDAQFQKKSLGKVKDVASQGRTVLFVSHNMAAVENICQRGIVLEAGKVIFNGNQKDSISQYLASVSKNLGVTMKDRTDRTGSGEIIISSVEIRDVKGNALQQVLSGQDIDICFHFERTKSFKSHGLTAGFMVRTHFDTPVFLQHNRLTGDDFGDLPEHGAFVCRVKNLPLPSANYRLGFSIMQGEKYLDRIDDACELSVSGGDFFGSGEVPPATHGCCLVEASWRILG